jgi:hypothetical protein
MGRSRSRSRGKSKKKKSSRSRSRSRSRNRDGDSSDFSIDMSDVGGGGGGTRLRSQAYNPRGAGIDDDDGFARAPLMAGPTGDSDDEESFMVNLERPATNPFWIRMFFVGILNLLLVAGATAACLTFSFWLSLAVGVVLFIFWSYTGKMWQCCFTKKTSVGVSTWQYYERRWSQTTSQIILIATLFGCIVGIGGGYSTRQFIVAKYGQTGVDVDATATADNDLGIALFRDNAHPFAELAGTAKGGIGLGGIGMNTCVAPIQTIKEQPKVGYWAISQGKCCHNTPIDCDNWSYMYGGIRVKYTELYPNVKKAVDDAVNSHKLKQHADTIYIQWGNPDILLDNLKFRAIVTACSAAGLGMILIFYKSLKG